LLKKHVIIVAGGDGKRMGNILPKQFLLLNKKPILFYAFNSFLFLDDIEFTLVLNKNYIDYWKKLCGSLGFNITHNIVEGGPTRFHSVVNGLRDIPMESFVLIHDAVRPFASQETITRVYSMALKMGNAIPSVPINDSIREIYGSTNKMVNRNNIRAIQTPQAFHTSLIKNAYNQNYSPSFTDDASVLESFGEKINLVDGNVENIKISNPIDLIIAKSIQSNINLLKI